MRNLQEDLTIYTDNGLSLLVFNTEHLYVQRHLPNFEDILRTEYRFTAKQFRVLEQDLVEDAREIENEK